MSVTDRQKPEAAVIARALSTNPASANAAQKAGLKLVWQGTPSKETIEAVGEESVQRLVFADRDLEPGMLDWLVSRGQQNISILGIVH